MVKSPSAGVSCPTFFLACREGLGKRRNIPSGETAYVCVLAAHCARGLQVIFAPLEKRGRRECRMRAAPAVSCANCAKKRTRAYRFSGGDPTFPAQWSYGLCRDLPGDEFVLSPSSAD